MAGAFFFFFFFPAICIKERVTTIVNSEGSLYCTTAPPTRSTKKLLRRTNTSKTAEKESRTAQKRCDSRLHFFGQKATAHIRKKPGKNITIK